MTKIRIPNEWDPLPHQRPLWRYWVAEGGKRFAAIWHRRAGKDSTCLNGTADHALCQRVGNYWHLFPQQRQGRKAIWNGVDRNGRRIIDQCFPPATRSRTNDQEMFIEFANGSTWQLLGSDNYDANVGANPVGVIFSEWALCDPRAWDYLRPILAENDGWAGFITTPRGQNHAYRLYQMALDNPDWHTELLTVEDTGLLSPEQIDAERRAGMSEDMISQEFYCSFEAAIPGSYFGKQMRLAREEGRICAVPVEPRLPVSTAWDLGIGDSTAIWLYQTAGQELRLVGYYESSGESLHHYFGWLEQWRQARDARWDTHWAPHDIEVREFTTGKRRIDVARQAGWTLRVVPKLPLEEGIEAVRGILGRCWFDARACEPGIAALSAYHKEYDDKHETWKDRPVHDWSSHGADAFRYLAVALRDQVFSRQQRPRSFQAPTQSWSVF